MNDQDIAQLLSSESEERYDFFLANLVEEKEVWILINDNNEFLKVFAQEEDFEYLPVWPNIELAKHYAKTGAGLTPKSIALPDFIGKWVKGLKRDDLEVGIIPAPDGSIWVMSAEELKNDIQDELSNML